MSSIVKKSLFHIRFILAPAIIIMLAAMVASCNSKEEEQEEITVTVSNLAIKTFKLKANSKVAAHLDSVFFSIDLDRGIIFNADSLPLGTDISRLVPEIEFASYLQTANFFYVENGQKKDSVEYKENMTDSVDFTRNVILDLLAADGENTFSYKIKVNVHKQKPDSLMWDRLAVMTLPSRMENPKAQKTVSFNDATTTIIREADNSLTLSTSTDLFNGVWEKSELDLYFDPDISSLTATSDNLWLLDTDGNLYNSPDGMTWASTGERWLTVIGPYLDSVLGVREGTDGLAFCHYPSNSLITDPTFEPGFPLSGRSALGVVETIWSDNPTAIFVGGKDASGELSGATWAFDGSAWTVINPSAIPSVFGMTLFRYVIYRKTGKLEQVKLHEAWYAMGGTKDDGYFNRDIFFSADNGVTWTKTGTLMTLPDYFPALQSADGIVCGATLESDLSDLWTRTDSRDPGLWLTPEYEVKDYDVSWVCPYVYIFGGTDKNGYFSNTIWRGVIARLAFTPQI